MSDTMSDIMSDAMTETHPPKWVPQYSFRNDTRMLYYYAIYNPRRRAYEAACWVRKYRDGTKEYWQARPYGVLDWTDIPAESFEEAKATSIAIWRTTR